MKYHQNAKTNQHLRKLIKESPASIRSLAQELGLSKNTVQKWRCSSGLADHSSRPMTIYRTFTKTEERVIVCVRKHLKLPLDDLVKVLVRYLPKINRSNCYRVLKAYRLAVLPKPFQIRGKFAHYPPGFVHLDLAYLPFLGGRNTRRYLLVAIDRVTKLVLVAFVPGKQQIWTIRFLSRLTKFFPYRIRWILTDNGKENSRQFSLACKKKGIQHRRTKIKHPWTNGQAEVTIRQIKQETIWKTYYHNDQELIQTLTGWVNTHNFADELPSLKGLTPCRKVLNYYREVKQAGKTKQVFRQKPTLKNLTICTITL